MTSTAIPTKVTQIQVAARDTVKFERGTLTVHRQNRMDYTIDENGNRNDVIERSEVLITVVGHFECAGLTEESTRTFTFTVERRQSRQFRDAIDVLEMHLSTLRRGINRMERSISVSLPFNMACEVRLRSTGDEMILRYSNEQGTVSLVTKDLLVASQIAQLI